MQNRDIETVPEAAQQVGYVDSMVRPKGKRRPRNLDPEVSSQNLQVTDRTPTTIEGSHPQNKQRKTKTPLATKAKALPTEIAKPILPYSLLGRPGASKKAILSKFADDGLKYFEEGKALCTFCAVVVPIFESKIQAHISTKSHRDRKITSKKVQIKNRISETFSQVCSTNSQAENSIFTRSILKAHLGLHFLESVDSDDVVALLSQSLGNAAFNRRSLADCIPQVLEAELTFIRQEIPRHKQVSIIYNDTCLHERKLTAIIIRFVSEDFTIQQRLVSLHFNGLQGSQHYADKIIEVYSSLEIPQNKVKFLIQDRGASNRGSIKAMEEGLHIIFNVIFCTCHILNNLGVSFFNSLPTDIGDFISAWCNLQSVQSYRTAFKQRFTHLPQTHSTIRWWSKFDVLLSLYNNFAEYSQFVMTLPSDRDVFLTKVKNMLSSEAFSHRIFGWLSFILDVCQIIRYNTTFFEGDGFIALFVYIRLYKMHNFYLKFKEQKEPYYVDSKPTEALLSLFTRGHPTEEMLFHTGFSELIDNFLWEFFHGSSEILQQNQWFELFSILDPNYIRGEGCRIEPSFFTRTTDTKFHFSVLPQQKLVNLSVEFSQYKSEVLLLAPQNLPNSPAELWDFWVDRNQELPELFGLASLAALAQPSSAAVERFFSHLKSHFHSSQVNSHSDRLMAEFMPSYNDRRRFGHYVENDPQQEEEEEVVALPMEQ